ncbi:uncharacterized protein BCR38DRAFT_432055 [Pseudomassariella vexata]|uniref:DUF6536 domain-containing protein n=1 Tax=Pseudomassariella vexata TaxID=1141098 RepID=A0A1Y2E0U0_9PEZI|nr:uncharacterized protein BCR38DRAFT_432055 [Pseudomassariella vexata]ORY65171.1 hypothetical protein BCR38DRAFT_432055 [Pseudomassariella vexata]
MQWSPVPSSEPSGSTPNDFDAAPVAEQRSKHITRKASSYATTIVDRFLKRVRGWRTGIGMCIIFSTLVLVFNLAISILSSVNPRIDGITAQHGLSTFYEGSCSTSKTVSIVTHLLLNILATILLGASNYCMQILVSPTRAEVDRAHAMQRWLRIGVPNIQNLPYIHWTRVMLWVLLGISSLPLHLLWNSAIIQTISSNNYYLGGVTEDFVMGANATAGSAQFIEDWFQGSEDDFNHVWYSAVRSPNVANLTTTQCIKAYGEPLISEYGNVAVVFDARNSTNSLLFAGTRLTGANDYIGVSENWVCGFPAPLSPGCAIGDLADDNSTYWTPLNTAANSPNLTVNPFLEDIARSNVSVKYCLAQPIHSPSRVGTTPSILFAVLGANALKVFCFICTWFIVKHKAIHEGEERMVVNGDLIASYLREPDLRFSGRCLASSRHVRNPKKSKEQGLSDVGFWDFGTPMPLPWLGGQSQRQQKEAVEQQPSRRRGIRLPFSRQSTSSKPGSTDSRKSTPRWHTGPSGMTWIVYIFPCAISIFALFALFFGNSLDKYLFIGFGVPSTQSTLSPGPGTGPGSNFGIFSSTLIANSPQLIASYIYLACNSVLTSMLAHHEVSSYAIRRRGLRVSFPRRRTSQRGTYYLQLPWRIALPLMTGSTVLHWLLSNSLFLLRVAVYNPDGLEDVSKLIATVGYSSSPILAVLGMVAAPVAGVLVLGWVKRYEGAEKMPLVATCSASLAAITCPSALARGHDTDGFGEKPMETDAQGTEMSMAEDETLPVMTGINTDTTYNPSNASVTGFGEGLAEMRLLWGVVGNGSSSGNVEHATFSAHPVRSLEVGRIYA